MTQNVTSKKVQVRVNMTLPAELYDCLVKEATRRTIKPGTLARSILAERLKKSTSKTV